MSHVEDVLGRTPATSHYGVSSTHPAEDVGQLQGAIAADPRSPFCPRQYWTRERTRGVLNHHFRRNLPFIDPGEHGNLWRPQACPPYPRGPYESDGFLSLVSTDCSFYETIKDCLVPSSVRRFFKNTLPNRRGALKCKQDCG